MALQDTFIWLFQKLSPNGRAFRAPEPIIGNGNLVSEDGAYNLISEDGNQLVVETGVLSSSGILWRTWKVIAARFAQVWTDAFSIYGSLFPEDPNFTIDDAHAWYRRLGIYDSGLVALDDMKQAIQQRRSFPNVPLAKQSLAFIQQQLQAAGFNVYLYQNRFPDGMGGWITKPPSAIIGTAPQGGAMSGYFQSGQYEYGQATLSVGGNAISGYFQSGQCQYGELSIFKVSKIVNYIEEAKDAEFVIADLRTTFYVAGIPINTFANVPASRQIEFRQLLLRLKPIEMIGFLFINYN